MRWCSDAACGLPLFSPHFTKKMILVCSPIHVAESADDSHEVGTEEIKSIFTSDRDQEILRFSVGGPSHAAGSSADLVGVRPAGPSVVIVPLPPPVYWPPGQSHGHL